MKYERGGRGVARGKIRNPKHEIRNKFEQMGNWRWRATLYVGSDSEPGMGFEQEETEGMKGTEGTEGMKGE